MPTLFIPKETQPGETRVAATPETVKKLAALGFEVKVEKGAGAGSFIADKAYENVGAVLTDASGWGSDVVAKLHPPTEAEAGKLKSGALLMSFLWPFANQDLVRKLKAGGVSSFAMDMIPRTTRAQKMDALSSQANIAGYKSVLLAAAAAPKLFPLLMTAAGTITPARVVILGAGVAGLQAIATARRLGAIVEVSDVRPAVKEQVQSLGGKFIEVEGAEEFEGEGGYAKQATPEFLKKQQDVVRKHIVEADVVITTAQVPGKPAPRLVSADMVRDMRDGAVIVDLAVETGGNCELSEAGKTVVKEGVTIIGQSNVPGTLPVHASDMYAKNIYNAIHDLMGKDKTLKLDFEDEIVAGSVVTHQGAIRHPKVAEAFGEPVPAAESVAG